MRRSWMMALATLAACGDGGPGSEELPENLSEVEIPEVPAEVEEQAPDELADESAQWEPLTCDILVPSWGEGQLALKARLPSGPLGEQVVIRYCGFFRVSSGRVEHFNPECTELAFVDTGHPIYCRHWWTNFGGSESLSGYAWIYAAREPSASSSAHPEYGMPLECEHHHHSTREGETIDKYRAWATIPEGGLVEVTWCGQGEYYDGQLLVGSDDPEDCTTSTPRYLGWVDHPCKVERTYTKAARERDGYDFSSWRSETKHIYVRVVDGLRNSFVPGELIICDDEFDPSTHEETHWRWIDDACLAYGRAGYRNPRCLEWFDGWEDLGCHDSQGGYGAVMSESIFETWFARYLPDYPTLPGVPTLSSMIGP